MESLDDAGKRVEQGDTAAFRLIVEATSSKLIRMSARMVGSVAEAEDVVQEVYVKAHRALVAGQFDHRSKLETWLYRIAVRTALDARRKRKHEVSNDEAVPDTAWAPLAQLEARQALIELNGWLEQLPEEQRAVLVLKVMEDMSSKEIAEVLECSEGAVEQRLVRARQALREKGGTGHD